MCSILIADSSESFGREVALQLEKQYCVRVRQEGEPVMQLLRSCKPDLLVLDLMLPGVDGISLLREITAMPEHPVILVTTFFSNGFVQASLAGMGVGYMMIKPCHVPSVADRIRELISHRMQHSDPSQLLLAMGIPARLRGSKYLREAIALMLADPAQSVTKELYPAVGAMYGVSGNRVERCIRNAVHSTWEKSDGRLWQQYFPADENNRVNRPTNSQFISRLLQIMREAG